MITLITRRSRLTILALTAALAALATLAMSCREPTATEPSCVLLEFGESTATELRVTAPGAPATHCLRVHLEAPSYLELSAREAGLELTLDLKSHEGAKTIATADSPTGRHGVETLRAVVETPGDYDLWVSGFGELGQSAHVDVEWRTSRLSTEADREHARRWRRALDISRADTLTASCGSGKEARDRALLELARLRDTWRELGDEDWAAWAHIELAGCWRLGGELARTHQELSAAEPTVRALDNPRLEADLEWQRGLALDTAGDKSGALAALESALALRRRDGDALKEGSTLLELAKLRFELGHVEEARKLYDQAIAMRHQQGDPVRIARALQLRANLSSEVGTPEEALEDLRVALALPLQAGRLEDLTVLGELHNTQGAAYATRGQLQQSIRAYQQSIEEHSRVIEALRAHGSPVEEMACKRSVVLYNLAGVFLSVEDERQARAALIEAEGSLAAAPCLERLALIEASLGELAFRQGEREEAFRRLDIAVSHAKRANSETALVFVLTSQGSVLRRAGRWAEAVVVLDHALEQEEAQRSFRLQALLLAELGDAFRQKGDRRRARAVLDRATALVAQKESQDGEVKALVLGRSAELLRDEKRLDEAWEQIESAMQLDESARRQLGDPTLRALFFGVRRYRYELALAILRDRKASLAENDVDALALAVSERARARVLRELLAEGLAEPRNEASIRAAIPADAVLLEFFAGQKSVYLLTVTRERLSFQQLEVPVAELPGAIGSFRQLVQRSDLGTGAEIARRGYALFEKLLAPVASELARASKIIVVADGPLFALPFDALVSAPSEDAWVDWDDVSYLVRRWQITYLPSASMLVDLQTAPERSSAAPEMDVVAVANPVVFERGLLPLPYSGEEAVQIAKLFSADRALVLQSEMATEARVRERVGEARILHFATHAIVNEEDATKTGLVLSRAPQVRSPSDDGLLDLAEISALHLKADLVVLSACSTARGEPIRGEGLIGLSRAFLLARVERQIVTLWPIEDEATGGLMQAFYREHILAKRGPAAALWAAKRQLVEQGKAPNRWAPFVFLGRVDEVPPPA